MKLTNKEYIRISLLDSLNQFKFNEKLIIPIISNKYILLESFKKQKCLNDIVKHNTLTHKELCNISDSEYYILLNHQKIDRSYINI